MTLTVEERIHSHYLTSDGIWLVETNKVLEAEMLKEAVIRIEQLKEDLEDAEAMVADWEDSFDEQIAEAIEEYRGRRDDFAALYDSTLREASKLRNSAKSYVSLADKFINEGKNGK